MSSLAEKLIAEPGSKFNLKHFDPSETHGMEKPEAQEGLARNVRRLSELQYLLYAEARRSVLVVLQGIDAGGKDGTIRNVFTGLNPQGISVTAFKVPEGAEKRHDYLWRIHSAVPEWGKIGVFNRSHYEEVLVVRVHDMVAKPEWSKRYRHINEFERMLSDNRIVIVKFLLMIDKDEQEERFKARLSDPQKNWKFSTGDLKEREHWDKYIEAFEDMLHECSTEYAPWYVIPANRKWFRNYAVSEVLVNTMERMDPQVPKSPAD